jgi:predicted secreted protein
MKTKKSIIGIGLVAIAIIAAGTVIGANLLNEKDRNLPASTTLFLTSDAHNSTVSLKNGDKINLTLPDYGDGGYIWTITNYDKTVLSEPQQSNWGSSGMLGDFGKDTWVFTAIHSGTTTLELVCERPFDGNDTCQTFVVTLHVE